MVIEIVILSVIAAMLAIMGIVVLVGKGDNLIAGYNTASKQEKAKYNVKRLRGLIGGLMLVLAPLMFINLGESSTASVISFCFIVFFLCIVVVILANTWARKKK